MDYTKYFRPDLEQFRKQHQDAIARLELELGDYPTDSDGYKALVAEKQESCVAIAQIDALLGTDAPEQAKKRHDDAVEFFSDRPFI